MSRRMPDWLFRRLDPILQDQRRLRREEDRREVERQDRELRAYYDRLRQEHESHTEPVPNCPYVPCVEPVGFGVR